MASSSPSCRFSASDEPWVEKHRPIYLKDIVGNEFAISRIESIARDGNMPNLILSGPPGTGKTTSILALAHDLLGPNYKEAVLELDASDDRGIDAVLNEITMFAQKKVTMSPGRYKIVILDKVDRVTVGVQEVLSRTIEEYSNSARFALTCYISRDIIKPIQSRCSLVQFSRLSDEDICDCLAVVIVKEKVPIDRELEGPKAIVVNACGDMRQALNHLQATFTGFGIVNRENVLEAYNQICSSIAHDETAGKGSSLHRIANALVQMDVSVMCQEALAHAEHLQRDVVRLCKERDNANERAAELFVQNEELNQRIINEQNTTRKLKARFLGKQRKWKVRLLNEQATVKRWKARFADDKVKRRKKAKKARKQVMLLEKKVFELEMVKAGNENAELQRKVTELEMAELQRKVAELESVQAAHAAAEQLLAL